MVKVFYHLSSIAFLGFLLLLGSALLPSKPTVAQNQLYQRDTTRHERGETEKAIKLWQKAVKINQNPAYQLALATAIYSKGETKQGLEMAKKALKKNKNLVQINKFKLFFWGDRLSADTQKLLNNLK